MNISGLLQTGEVVAVRALAQAQIQALNLELGQILTARVAQLTESGRGFLQLAEGVELSFAKGAALTEGEQVRLQVVRTQPEMTLRVVATEAGEAGKLADATERSVLRVPELFSRLLRYSGLADTPSPPAARGTPATNPPPAPPLGQESSGLPPTPASNPLPSSPIVTTPHLTRGEMAFAKAALLTGNRGAEVAFTPLTGQPPVDDFLSTAEGGKWLPPANPPLTTGRVLISSFAEPFFSNQLVTGTGEKLSQLLRTSLPNLSLDDLMKGDVQGLAKLMTGQGDNSPPLGEAIHRLRVAAESLHWTKNNALSADEQKAVHDAIREAGGEGAVLREAKQSLQRLGDVLASQDLMPKNQPAADGSAFLGYRVFWLPQGGMGEIMWRRDKANKQGSSEGKQGFSVLLSLQLSRLGLVQANVAMGEGYLNVAISARDEGALDSLRLDIGELRDKLIQAELPLRTLNLSRLNEQEMQEERRQSLGFAGNLRMEV